MKAVILAGGFGTRISEETSKPKPMVESVVSQYYGISLNCLVLTVLMNL